MGSRLPFGVSETPRAENPNFPRDCHPRQARPIADIDTPRPLSDNSSGWKPSQGIALLPEVPFSFFGRKRVLMIESCDIKTGVALATAGLLGLSGWVWRDAEDRGNRAAPVWALGILLTAGTGTIIYLLHTRRLGSRFFQATALWGLWTLLIAVGSYGLVMRSAIHRGADTGNGPAAPASSASPVIHPSWGAFDKAFPGAPSQTQPTSPSR